MGREKEDIVAQLELVYSTDYTGDVSTATWISMKKI